MEIIRAGRAVLQVSDLDRSLAFYEALGFVVTERVDEQLFLRGLEEHNHHSLCLKKASEAVVETISYKVMHNEDLERLATLFQEMNLPVRWLDNGEQHAIGRCLRVSDPSGLTVEFYRDMPQAERLLQRFELHRGAKVQRIDHFNCMVDDVEAAHQFYTEQLGFRCSEYTATEEEKIWASWLHRKPSVHDVAFMNSAGPRLHHVGFWLKDPMSLIDACDVLAAMNYGPNIERGPGRHGLSNAFFLYLRDPDGHRIELYNGDYLTSDPDFKPVRWDLNDPKRATFWGHEAPDSWFEEASSFLDVHGTSIVPTREPKLEKKKPTFII
ncbi:3,4-dihydroxyphenylacetate 2,3-dioxygenase [Geomicrobium sp. JCM 19037]|uniref:3,4-dihydroxyphenylacetate 2,3-dioxygenase n=1 Tax=Geomicrobium sp. JCM 19037 TaxID=1460634 RepID=UPI00045F41C1|nr:3,4-dihydroxyphenylacetate 2,3-dioxygenase [Geomicrobium sp. JCM 19037]GAK03875.1 3,4-dihydroxyphenylacetate 2,3-dioxygenase [Geomicrobium sp. JCM 19037]